MTCWLATLMLTTLHSATLLLRVALLNYAATAEKGALMLILSRILAQCSAQRLLQAQLAASQRRHSFGGMPSLDELVEMRDRLILNIRLVNLWKRPPTIYRTARGHMAHCRTRIGACVRAHLRVLQCAILYPSQAQRLSGVYAIS